MKKLEIQWENAKNSRKIISVWSKKLYFNFNRLNVCFSYNFTNELEHSMKVVSEKYDLT